MATNYRVMRVIYRCIKRIDGWMGYPLDNKDYHMTIRKINHVYHIDVYNKDDLVDTNFAMDDHCTINRYIRFLLDMMHIWLWMLAGWVIGTQYDRIRSKP